MKKPNKKQVKILIVDDDSFLLNMYATKFETENFDVVVAEDGERGLELAKKERPDIILLDVLMPRKNGLEVLEELKADKDMKDIPVILLTNINKEEEAGRGINLGADDYLIKAHFVPSEVVSKIKEVLKKKG